MQKICGFSKAYLLAGLEMGNANDGKGREK